MSIKCFYHPEQDAVGMCTQCGKAACHNCMKEVEGGMLCKGCIAHQLQAIQDESKAAEEERQATIGRAQRRLKISKIVFVVSAIAPLFSGAYMLSLPKDPQAPGMFGIIAGVLLASAIMGYTVWSCFWGFPAIWRGLRRMFAKMGLFVVLNPI